MKICIEHLLQKGTDFGSDCLLIKSVSFKLSIAYIVCAPLDFCFHTNAT